MMIVADFPSTSKIEGLRFRIVPNSRGLVSPFSKQGGFSRLDGDRWAADIDLVSITSHQAADTLAAMLSRLDGRVGVLALGDSTRATPRGVAAGAPGAAADFTDDKQFSDATDFNDASYFGKIAGASARGDDTIHMSGLVVSTTAVLKAGDLFQVGSVFATSQLFQVVNDCNSDASGETRVNVRPRVRHIFSVGELVTFKDAKAVFRLASDLDDAQRRVSAALAESLSLSFIEVVSNA